MLGLLFAAPASADPVPAAVPACTVTDPRLAELSGLVADDQHWYAITDGGTSAKVWVLGKDCQVQDSITGAVDPYDVEDLARGADGTFWLSDTGDNDEDRDTIALISLTPAGEAAIHRLTYPDGRHDAEALLLDPAGVPYVITKNPLGTADVYRPAGPLASPGPTPLTHVVSVRLRSTDTPGGPVPGVVGSVVVTGASTSADGTAIALRTYTDAYVFPMRDGDVVAALEEKPVRVPLPNEPQGEAIAFQPDGSLVSGSESGRENAAQSMNVVAGAAALVAPEPPPDVTKSRSASKVSGKQEEKEGLAAIPAAAVTVAVIGVIYLLFRSMRRRRTN
nr:esterase-like activity of phytase family protein [Actinophytocola oryzae]